MISAVLVGIFGISGALLRFATDSWFAHHSSRRTVRLGLSKDPLHWPWATLVVNVAGSFIIGISYGLTTQLGLGHEWSIGLATGFAGGLTTFSSWTTATVRLLGEARFGAAAMNLAMNLVLGLGAAAAGIALVS
ncbi:camphor resistance protein CrcB [Pseudarthrobacter equi]|uniref:Fluoride-specific ion channel FluC n=1 Tax=Pseudarthrobacter equi TaxID=728066 RepID=A0A1H2A6A4_9MICC|nr:CrcB family protein [Pseudarthrobacter equi]SDT41312.1 camphor resistance protein CrcB [Pseudarthrobacter equi]